MTTAAPPARPKPLRGVVEEVSPRAERAQRLTMLAATVLPLAGVVTALVLLWGRGVGALDLGLLIGFYVATGLGITVGFHRLFAHRSFEARPWVRVAWAVAGSLAIQGSVISWVATHRRHHAYSDEEGDPHSPHVDAGDGWRGILRGLYHAHVGWMMKPDGTVPATWAPDLQQDPAIARVDRAFPAIVVATLTVPALIGGLATMSLWGAVTAFLWGSLVRVFLLHHVTWAINSICHFYGTRPFESHDESRNNPIMALLAFGEGWHNAHHAFPGSARHGLRWWELDVSWITIRAMQLLRLAGAAKLPSPRQMVRKARAA